MDGFAKRLLNILITINIMLIKISLIGDSKAGMAGLLVLSDQKPDRLIRNPILSFTVQTHILGIRNQEK